MRCLLLTGVAGFLGRHIARLAIKAGTRVVGVDVVPPENAPAGIQYHRLQMPGDEFTGLLKSEQPDACIHAAGRASVGLSLVDPRADFHGNTVLTFEILEAIRQFAPQCRFVLLSSAAVYGNPTRLPIAESQHLSPLSPYGYHKRLCELLCQEYARIHGVAAVSARIFSAYGPGLRRQVVWDICENLITRGTVKLGGTGAESRDFIHAQDVAAALLLLARSAPAEGETYNVASGIETTISELATTLVRALHLDVEPRFDGTVRAGDPLNWCADVARIQALGFTPSMTLESGLQQVATWARAELVAS